MLCVCVCVEYCMCVCHMLHGILRVCVFCIHMMALVSPQAAPPHIPPTYNAQAFWQNYVNAIRTAGLTNELPLYAATGLLSYGAEDGTGMDWGWIGYCG